MNGKLNTIIRNFYKYLLLVSLIIGILALSFLYIFVKYYLSYAITFFYFLNNPINYFITISTSTVIVGIFVGIFAYFYFFDYIKKKGATIFVSEENESKYFSSFLSSYIIFNYAILLPFSLFLFFIKKSVLEFIALLIFYLITIYIFIPFMESYKKLNNDYTLLHQLNQYYGFLFSLNIFKKLMDDISSIVTDFNNYQKYIQPLWEDIIGVILLRSLLLLRYIFVFTLFVGFFSIIWEFNLLSIIYIEMTLIFWYFIISAFLFMPKKEVNILLNNNECLEKVYMLEDSPKGEILILTSQNKMVTIYKDSVIKIELN